MEQCGCNVDVMWNIVEECGCFLEKCGRYVKECGCLVDVLWNIVEECGCFVEKCGCNMDPPHLQISQFVQSKKISNDKSSPSLVSHLEICDRGCNVDPSDFHIDN